MRAEVPTTRTAVTDGLESGEACARRQARLGVVYAVAAYVAWGVFPVYFKAVKHVPAVEVVAHRVIWSVVFLLVLMAVRRNWRTAVETLRCRRTVATLCLTTCLIACNWLIFIWAIANDHLLEVSLGYFINPLVNVLLGFVFLRERLRRWQMVSVALAAIGVAYLTYTHGKLPGVALVLAMSFGVYGLLRKTVRADALVGLTVETMLLSPIALLFLGHQMIQGQAVFAAGSLKTDALLVLAGVVTATPLLWFTAAARRLRYITVGFIQYLAPTGHFLLAVLVYGEPFAQTHLIAFACIWTGLLIYSVDAAVGSRPVTIAALPE